MNADVVIVGAGPAGIFTALEMIKKGSRQKIVMVEKGQPVEKRHCPKDKTKKCVNCKPYCHITTGFSGAGAFSDGKLSLSYEVGGDLPTLIGEEFAQKLIDYTDKIYLEFGADPHVEGIYTGEEIKEIRKNAIHAGLKLVDCPIRHLGTEKAQQLYLAIQNYLADNGVEMLFNTECENIILENEECKGVLLKDGDQALKSIVPSLQEMSLSTSVLHISTFFWTRSYITLSSGRINKQRFSFSAFTYDNRIDPEINVAETNPLSLYASTLKSVPSTSIVT